MNQPYDLLVRGGTVHDGTGAAPRRADVAVTGDRIAAVGDLATATARSVVDATGKAVAPGFIDVHTHDDRALLSNPDMAMKTSQGVTTVVVGNCGVSLSPLSIDRRPPPPLDLLGDREWYRFPRMADYMAAVDAAPAAVNAACLVGHSTLRVGVMDDLMRGATASEIGRMRERLAEGLEAGAIGLSTGLFYRPANAAPTEEVIALAGLLAPAGALYTTHMRDEADDVMKSLEETFRIGREAGVRAIVSHHKVTGTANFGRSRETLALIERTRAGQDIGLDCYPYIAASTVLDGNRLDRCSRIMVTWSTKHPEVSGRDLADIAAEWGISQLDAVDRLNPAGAIYFMMDEPDVRRILGYPHTIVASDGLPHDAHPHPRLWGTFPRVLGHYARDVGLFPMEEAVRRMTSLPAERFRLAGRGTLAPGFHADITIFDPATVIDSATFAAPATPARGIERVYVNGRAVWQDGAVTGAHPGRLLRRQALQAAA
ncbi:MAG: D-aminoacylase [Alphaproteobacteria bacterium]|nr:D-aminoacylase [Alphaproteobacteria bacterium]